MMSIIDMTKTVVLTSQSKIKEKAVKKGLDDRLHEKYNLFCIASIRCMFYVLFSLAYMNTNKHLNRYILTTNIFIAIHIVCSEN